MHMLLAFNRISFELLCVCSCRSPALNQGTDGDWTLLHSMSVDHCQNALLTGKVCKIVVRVIISYDTVCIQFYDAVISFEVLHVPFAKLIF